MGVITKEQVRRIYALGAAAGMVESGSHDDTLHAMVAVITGKDKVSGLTEKEFEAVQRELLSKIRYSNRTEPLKSRKKDNQRATAPGMMNAEQQGKAWKLIYILRDMDTGSTATAGQRMVGAIKKILGVDARLENPFGWLTQAQGAALIDQLKRYVRSAEARQKKRGSG